MPVSNNAMRQCVVGKCRVYNMKSWNLLKIVKFLNRTVSISNISRYTVTHDNFNNVWAYNDAILKYQIHNIHFTSHVYIDGHQWPSIDVCMLHYHLFVINDCYYCYLSSYQYQWLGDWYIRLTTIRCFNNQLCIRIYNYLLIKSMFTLMAVLPMMLDAYRAGIN